MSHRLDQALVRRGLVRSRSQGKEFILAGRVSIDGVPCLKPSRDIEDDIPIALDGEASAHRVGRGYDKLRAFLENQPLDFDGRRVVDGGASTGGFTQLALERGAAAVAAVELGEGQLVPELQDDPRVIDMSGTDLLEIESLAWPCDILLLDLSCLSLLEALPALKIPLADDAALVALVKPRYIGELRPRRGEDAGEAARRAVRGCLRETGWEPLCWQAVALGPDQVDRESFILARRSGAGKEP